MQTVFWASLPYLLRSETSVYRPAISDLGDTAEKPVFDAARVDFGYQCFDVHCAEHELDKARVSFRSGICDGKLGVLTAGGHIRYEVAGGFYSPTVDPC